MRIVHVVIGGHVAGGQLVALRLARAARERGHEVSFVSPSAGPFLDLVEGEGMRARIVPIRGALDVRAIAALRRVLGNERADVVHTHAHFSINVVARVAGRLAGAHVVAHMHIGNAFRSGRAGRVAQVALDDATARLCSSIVAVSDATRRSLERQGYPRDRLVTIHNGIERVDDVAPAEVGAAGASHVVEIARLADVKGQRLLVAALARLPEHVVVLLVGEDVEHGGAYRDLLAREAEAAGVASRVRFLGRRDDVPAVIAAADVVALPSLDEGLPLVLLEAMAQGKPVVASAVGGTPELVVDGETGVLVPPGDVDALVDALASVLGDPERARRLGEAGRARVREKFSADAAAEKILDLYESATRVRRSARADRNTRPC
jgi:glycosyltransferase involved in cell wall biosynthesis